MKKLLLALVLCLFGSGAQAQMSVDDQINQLLNQQQQMNAYQGQVLSEWQQNAALLYQFRMINAQAGAMIGEFQWIIDAMQAMELPAPWNTPYQDALSAAESILPAVSQFVFTADAKLDSAQALYEDAGDPIYAPSTAVSLYQQSINVTNLAALDIMSALNALQSIDSAVDLAWDIYDEALNTPPSPPFP